jgi:LCP family protein required for cell wall assembly
MRDDDNGGRKPYRTYKAGRARRSSVDDELAGARPLRNGRTARAADQDARPDYPERSHKAYRTYGPPPGGGKKGRKQGTGAVLRRRRFRWWFVPVGLLIAVIVAGTVVTVLAWPGYKKFDRAVTKANHRVDKNTRAQLTADDGWIWRHGTTLLLLGLDQAAEPAHSDTIMLMRFNPKTHSINQLSIPRDTRVAVAGHGFTKINEAMWYGGSSLALKTVEQYTGIPINHIMIVNFQGFPRLVDAVGGVDMRVPQTVTTYAGSEQRPVTFKKGMHHFDGKFAMLYVRIRKAYANGDFTRAERQQAFVQALEKKIARPSNITRLPLIGRRFMRGVATDLTTNQIIELAYLKWRSSGGKKAVMVGQPAYIGGVAYVLPPDAAARQKMVHQFLTR